MSSRPKVDRGHLDPAPVLFGDVVLVADDAGTFVEVTPAHGETEYVHDAFFADRQHGWVGFTNYDEASGRLVRTLDGGRTWEPTDLDARVHQSAGSRVWLHFLDTDHGWAVQFAAAAGGGGIQRTSDGGRTWSNYQELPVPGPVRFQTPRHGWLAGWYGPGSYAGFYETVDGGDTWRQRAVAPPEGTPADALAYRLPIFYGDRGVLPVPIDDDRVAFYTSSDAGRDWRLAATAPVPASARAGIAVASANEWWAVAGDGGAVTVTEDAGRTWTSRRRAGLPEVIIDVEAQDAQRAWAVASNQGGAADLYETTDGGNTWRATGHALDGKKFSYRGVSLVIPADWPVRNEHPPCPAFNDTGLFISEPPTEAEDEPSCSNSSSPPSDGVRIGPLVGYPPTPDGVAPIINGVRLAQLHFRGGLGYRSNLGPFKEHSFWVLLPKPGVQLLFTYGSDVKSAEAILASVSMDP